MNQSKNFVGQHLLSQILRLTSKEELAEVFRETKTNRYYREGAFCGHALLRIGKLPIASRNRDGLSRLRRQAQSFEY